MTENELDLLKNELSQCTRYLEFGSGESTLLAIDYTNIEQIITIESDSLFWQEMLYSNEILSKSIKNNRLDTHLVDIGEISSWGYPESNDYKRFWPRYSLIPFIKKAEYDLILIDGRFRVACTLRACLTQPKNVKILIHDYFCRPYYWVVSPFLNLIDKVDTMGLFTINENVDVPIVKNVIEEYIKIYGYEPGM